MRSFGILPSLNGNDKPGAQAASTSDVRKPANRCWNTNPSKSAPPPPQPVSGPGWDGSRPTSIRSLPILPSQRTPCADLPDTPHQDKQSHSGLRGPSTEPSPVSPSQCRTSSKQSSLSLPMTDVGRGKRGKRKKPSRRYREVFVWDHRTSICSDPGMISITKETDIALETNNSMGMAVENHGRNMYTPNGQARLKRKQRTQGLLGMLDRPVELDQLCKTPIPHTALTNQKSSKMSFPSNTIVLPPISQDYDTSTSECNPRSERGLSEMTRVEQTHKKPAKRKTRAKKGLKSKMAPKEKMKPKDIDMDVKNEGTSNAYGSEEDDDDDDDDYDDDDDGGGDDNNDNNSDMGWTDDDDDDYESRVNSQMRKSACSTSQFSRASGFTMSSVEIKMSGDDGDDVVEEGDDEDDENGDDDEDDENGDDNDGDGDDNEDTEEDCGNYSEDNEDEDDADDMEVQEMEDETIKDSDDEDDEDMFVRISDYGESEDENEEENTTDAGDTAINGTENMSDTEELDDDGDENDEDDDGNDDETSTYVEDDEASNN